MFWHWIAWLCEASYGNAVYTLAPKAIGRIVPEVEYLKYEIPQAYSNPRRTETNAQRCNYSTKVR